MLVAAFGVALPVRATVTDASLARLDLAAAASSSTVAYNLSLTVRLRNRNWAMRVETTAPLDAELRFAGHRFDGARLAEPGARIPPRGAEEFHVLGTSKMLMPDARRGTGTTATHTHLVVLPKDVRCY